MDILEIEDVLKGLPDQALRQEAQQPSGQVPQYMVVSEIQRRSKMRKRFEAQQEQPSTTVAEQILTGGVASVAPPPSQMMGAMGMPQQAPAPQQQPPMQPQQMPPQQPPMPPPVRMQRGGDLPYAGQPAGQEENIRDLLLQFSEEDLIQQMPFLEDAIREVARINRSGVNAYDVPSAGSVSPAAPTIDTRTENLLSNQTRVIDPQYLSEDAQAFRRGLSKIGTTIAEAPGKFLDSYIDPTMMMDPRIAQQIEGSKGVAKGNVMVQGIKSLYPEIFDKPATKPQVAVAEPPLSVPEQPYGMLRSDAVGLGPLRSNQNIVEQTISEMALVGDQPVVTDVASSGAVTNDAQTGAVAPKSTGTTVTKETIEAATSDVTPEDKVEQDIAKNFTDVVAPSFADLISEQERRLAKIREDAKRDVGAQALINLGAGIAEGDVSGGLVRAGQAASKVRAAERAAESDIANMQARIKMAEEQGKFDLAKALRAEQVQLYRDATKAESDESQFVRTLGLSKQKLLAEVEKEAGVDARAKLAAAISIMEEEIDPKKKQRLIDRIARQYLPMLNQGVIANNQSGATQGNQNRPPISSFGG